MVSALLVTICDEKAASQPPTVASGNLSAEEIKAKQEQMRKEFEAAGRGDQAQEDGRLRRCSELATQFKNLIQAGFMDPHASIDAQAKALGDEMSRLGCPAVR